MLTHIDIKQTNMSKLFENFGEFLKNPVLDQLSVR